MERLGTDFNATGSVMSKEELESQRRKRGECVTCGRKCFQKKLFKMIPITEHGQVLQGRCLNCKPLDTQEKDGGVLPAVSRPASREDLARFTLSQSNLNLSGPGVNRPAAAAATTVRKGNRAPATRGSRRSAMSRQPSSHTVSSGTSGMSGDSGSSDRQMNMHDRTPSIESTSTAPVTLGVERSSSGYGERRRPMPPGPTVSSQSLHRYIDDNNYMDSQHGSGQQFHLDQMQAYANHNGMYTQQQQQQEFDVYNPLQIERRLSSESMHSMRDVLVEEAAYASQIAAAGGHSISSQLASETAYLDSLNQREIMYADVNNSQRSLYSSASSHHTHHTAHGDLGGYAEHGMLNRGGAITFSAMGQELTTLGSSRSLHSRSSQHSGRNSGHRRPMHSQRSLDTMTTYGDDMEEQNPLPPPPTPPNARSLIFSTEQSSIFANYGQEDLGGLSYHSAHHSDAHLSESNQSYRSSEHHMGHQQMTQSPFSTRSLMGSQSALLMSSQTSSGMLNATVNASRDSDGLDRIQAAGGDFLEIISCMRDYADSPAVQATGMQELSNLHLSQEDNDRFADIGAIYVIVDGMRNFPMDVELQISGCRAMWNASGTMNNQLAFVEAGALDVILLCMGHYIGDSDVQEQAMATLANLSAVELNVEIMMERGVVGAIVDAMNKHTDNIHVQMKGCGAITNMASHVAPLKRVIMESGGGGSVVISMVMHPDNPVLQEKALRALRNLSANCEENKIELASIGGIDAVISAMQVHRDSAGVQEAGAWTLSNLAGNAENKVLIGDYGGVDVTIRAMWVHSDNAKVQEWCCRCLYSLSLDPSFKNSNLIREVGGISAIVNAMQAHVDHSTMQEMGCAVLCNLGYDAASKIQIVNEESLDAIVLAMVLHSEDAKVQERGCQVLIQLAMIENIKAMQASNIGALVRSAGERFPELCGQLASHLLQILDELVLEYNTLNS
jgi:hypothetical protein